MLSALTTRDAKPLISVGWQVAVKYGVVRAYSHCEGEAHGAAQPSPVRRREEGGRWGRMRCGVRREEGDVACAAADACNVCIPRAHHTPASATYSGKAPSARRVSSVRSTLSPSAAEPPPLPTGLSQAMRGVQRRLATGIHAGGQRPSMAHHVTTSASRQS